MTLKKNLVNLLLSVASISLPLITTDIILKKIKYSSSNKAYLLIGGGYIGTKPNTKVKSYSKGEKIRHSVVIGKEVIYDYEFKTDQNGFRITHECNKSNKDSDLIAITGDSFTAGQGVSNISWASALQKIICERNYQSANLSFPGIGLIDMKNNLKFAKQELKAKKAVVSIITEDIYRPYSSLESNEECAMFLNSSNKVLKCGQTSATWWYISKSLKKDQLLDFAEKKNEYGLFHISKKFLKDFNIRSKRTIKNLLPPSFLNKLSTKKNYIIKDSSNALNQIASDFKEGNIILIILPSKTDRNLAPDQKYIERQNNNLKIFLDQINPKITIADVRSCPLNKKHFYKDGHPNFEGQMLLGKCVINNQKIKEFIL